jgi:hypothetical protein
MLSIWSSIAQPVIQWQVSLGGTDIDQFDQGNAIFNNLIITSDGGVAFAGTSFSNDGDVFGHHGISSTSDIWFGNLDSLGNLEWQKSLGGTENEIGKGLCQTPDGDFVIIGESWSDDGDISGHIGSTSTMDIWVVKLDDQGNIEWERSYGGTANDTGIDIKQSPDGSFVIAADTWSTDGDVSFNHGSIDFWFARIDANGAILWEKSFGGSSGERVRSIQLTPDGGVISIGMTSSTDGDITSNPNTILPSIWVLKIDSLGNKEWDKCFGGMGNGLSMGTDIQVTPDGGYILNSWTTATNGNVSCSNGGGEAWVAKLDASGNIVWSACYGGPGGEFGKSVRPLPDGGFLISATSDNAGGMVSNHIGGTDCWIVKTDSLGNIEWDRAFGGTNSEIITTAVPVPDGGYILGAESLSNDGDVSGHHGPLSTKDIWIVKLAPMTSSLEVPRGSTLSGLVVSPNPFTGQLAIEFRLNSQESVKMELYDLSGRKIALIEEAVYTSGKHRIEKNLSSTKLPGGVYILKLSAGEFIRTVRVTCIAP